MPLTWPRAILAIVGLAAVAATQAQALVTIDLPQQPLAYSLSELASQTHSNILFNRAQVEGLIAQALKAQLNIDDALARLLAGTRLTYRRADANTIVVFAADASGSGAANTKGVHNGIQARDARLTQSRALGFHSFPN